jgi:creatinine amidohydrolase
MAFIATTTSTEVAAAAPDIAVLPVGSWEQHGDHLPLATDAIIAATIANRLATVYNLFELPPITIACSHEHEGFPGRPGTVSISAATLIAIISDIHASLRRSGIEKLVLINCHGGNYALSNVVQQANVDASTSMGLFPRREDWDLARSVANLTSRHGPDMHAGELETSILLHTHPELVKPSYRDADVDAPSRPDLLVKGLAAYSDNGVIGFPSEATAAKGGLVLDSLVDSFGHHLKLFRTSSAAK